LIFIFAVIVIGEGANKVFLTLLLEIKTSIADMSSQMAMVIDGIEELKSASSTYAAMEENDDLLKLLPLHSKDDLDHFQELVHQDKNHRGRLVSMIMMS
jgi:hypothetical protein